MQPLDRPQSVDITQLTTKAPEDAIKEEIQAETKRLGDRLEELFDLLYFAGQQSLLIVLQGMDTSGKDGTIRRILKSTHAQSVHVASFKVPTPEELAHDFLWRCHKETPGVGEITIFNRSHYEDVLVVRVHDLVPEKTWRARYDQINDWERMLAANRTIILKFFLHISKEEQEERLLAREEDVTKAWKLSVGDWKERKRWDDYQQAYADALGQCAAPGAPWYVVPADKKWYRDYLVVRTIVEALEPYEKGWLEELEKVGDEAKAELAAFRASP